MVTVSEAQDHVEYAIPEGCPVCETDLEVRVSRAGAYGVCLTCGYIARPTVALTHSGLKVEFIPGADA